MHAYRKIPCMNCGVDDGTVCGAHSNWGNGKGMGIKSSDYCASLCRACHFEIDQGHRLSKDERLTLWTRAHHKTVRELLAQGLWPMDVPVPDLRVFH